MREKGVKPREMRGECRSQRLSLIPPNLAGNYTLHRPQKHASYCGSAEQKKGRDTIRLVKSTQLVQRTRGHLAGRAVVQKFPSVGKIHDWNGSVSFATANLYLSVIKLLSAKEIPCSLSQTWGHPFSL